MCAGGNSLRNAMNPLTGFLGGCGAEEPSTWPRSCMEDSWSRNLDFSEAGRLKVKVKVKVQG